MNKGTFFKVVKLVCFGVVPYASDGLKKSLKAAIEISKKVK